MDRKQKEKNDRQKGTGEIRPLRDADLGAVSGGNYSPGAYREEAKAFLRQRMQADTFDYIMSHGSGSRYPYVAARIYLGPEDWDKYVWIEQHGSLDGYPG